MNMPDEDINYILQYWETEVERWVYIRSFDRYSEAEAGMEMRNKLDGHLKVKYRILKQTTTYEVVKE
jgi:hypothetical protein